MTQLPPIDWFRDPGLAELTPLTVTADGQVFGHIAGWSTSHASFPGRQIKPPRSRSDYSLFHTGSLPVADSGRQVEISVGHLSMGGGHAGTELSQKATAAYYDDVSSVAADVCVGEDVWGIWFSGALAPDMDELRTRRFRSCALSGDWRHVDGLGLELTAVLSVVTPGFPVPRARVASGAPMALVAAGAVVQPLHAAFGKRVADGWTAPAAKACEVKVGKLLAGTLRTGSSGARLVMNARTAQRTFNTAGERVVPAAATQGPSPADVAAIIANRKQELAAENDALVASLDDTGEEFAGLMAAADDTAADEAALRWALAGDTEFDVSTMPPQLRESYLHGKAAAKILWGTPGDFARCEAEAKHHGIPARMRPGMCATLHKEATGEVPGKHANG